MSQHDEWASKHLTAASKGYLTAAEVEAVVKAKEATKLAEVLQKVEGMNVPTLAEWEKILEAKAHAKMAEVEYEAEGPVPEWAKIVQVAKSQASLTMSALDKAPDLATAYLILASQLKGPELAKAWELYCQEQVFHGKLAPSALKFVLAPAVTGFPTVVHSKSKDDWETPWDFFLWLDSHFHFTLDVCATPGNAKCRDFLTPEIDGLEIDWWGRVFMNPPYSRVGEWMNEMTAAVLTGEIDLGVALVAARPDTQWWWDAVIPACEVWFLKGRLHFTGPGGMAAGAPFPSAVLVYRPGLPLGTPREVNWVDWKSGTVVPASSTFSKWMK